MMKHWLTTTHPAEIPASIRQDAWWLNEAADSYKTPDGCSDTAFIRDRSPDFAPLNEKAKAF